MASTTGEGSRGSGSKKKPAKKAMKRAVGSTLRVASVAKVAGATYYKAKPIASKTSGSMGMTMNQPTQFMKEMKRATRKVNRSRKMPKRPLI